MDVPLVAAFLGSFVLSAATLRPARFRLGLLHAAVATTSFRRPWAWHKPPVPLFSSSQAFRRWGPPLHWLALAAVLSPAALLAVLVAATAADDGHLALGVALVGGCWLAATWGALLLRAAGWRSFRTPRVLMLLALALYAAYLLVFLSYLDPFTFVGSSAVFVFLSLIPMLRLLHEQSSAAPLSVHKFLLAMREQQVEGNLDVSRGLSTRLTALLRGVGYYLLSLGCLVANAVLVWEKKPEAPGLGVAVLAAALVLDATLYLYRQARLLTNPTSVALVCAACRISLFSFGADYWFLGHGVLYLLICGLLATRIVMTTYPSEARQAQDEVLQKLAEEAAAEREESRAREKAEAALRAEQAALAERLAASESGSEEPAAEPAAEEGEGTGMQRFFRAVRRGSAGAIAKLAERGRRTSVVGQVKKKKQAAADKPQQQQASFDDYYAILLFVTFFFGLETAFVHSGPDALLLPDVRGKSQSLYGLGAMATLLTYFVCLSALMHYRRHARLHKRLSLSAYALVALLSAYASFLSGSDLAAICGALGPFALLCFGIGYLMWARNDFNFELANLSAEDTVGLSVSVSCLSLPCIPRRIDDIILRWQGVNPIWQYWTQALAVVAVLAALLAWRVSMIVGLTAGVWLVVGAMLFLLNRKWFQTFEADGFMWSLLGALAVFVCGWAFTVYWLDDESDEMGLRVLFAAVGLPVMVLLGMAVLQWRDDGWIANRFVKVSMAVVLLAVAVLATGVASFVDVASGVGFGVSVLLLSACVCVIAKWRLNGYYLPPAYFWVARVALFTVIVGGVVLGAVTGRYFFGGSIAWAGLGAAPLALAVYDEAAYGDRDIICSAGVVFPVFSYDAASKSLRDSSRGPFAAFTVLGMTFVWGLCAGLFVEPSYLGIWVASLSLVLGILYAQRCKARTGALLQRILLFARADVVSVAYESAEPELEADEAPLVTVGGGSVASSGSPEGEGQGELATPEEIGAVLSGTAEELAHMDRRFREQRAAVCRGRFAVLPPVAAFHILRELCFPPAAEEEGDRKAAMAELLGADDALTHGFTRMTRFTALLQLLVNALTEAEVRDAETEFQTFLRTIGLHDVSPAEMDAWPEHIKQSVEEQWDDFVRAQIQREEAQREARLKAAEETALREQERQEAEELARAEIVANKDRAMAEERARQRHEDARHQEAIDYMNELLMEADAASVRGDHHEEERVRELYRKCMAEEEEVQALEMARREQVVLDWERRAAGELVVDLEKVEHQIGGEAEAKFSDAEFPPSDASLGDRFAGQGLVWERLSALSSHVQLYEDGASADDIKQGQLGDCWLLSAAACVATRPELVHQLFIKAEPQRGYYVVRFHKNGNWKEVVIDDYFPCVQAGGSKSLAFARSQSVREAWVQVLEKAYAKLHGSYSSIETGLVHFGLVDMTGGASQQIQLTDAATRADINSGALFAKLLQLRQDGYLLGAGSPEGSDTDVSPMGIVQGHAYSILDVQAVDGHQLLQMRNPWGRVEWTGAWSDRSSEWTKRLRKKLDYRDANDGTFWIAFADMVIHFACIYVCRVFSEEWHRKSVESAWAGRTAGGCVNFDTVGDNPQFHLNVAAPATVYIVLAQNDRRGADGGNFHIGFVLLDLQGNRVPGKYSQRAVVGTSGTFLDAREVSLEVSLQPAAHPYTILPTTFHPGEENAFTITAYSRAEVELEELPADWVE